MAPLGQLHATRYLCEYQKTHFNMFQVRINWKDQLTFPAGVFKHISHSSNISFLSTGRAFLYCGIKQPGDTCRVIKLFAAAYVILTHKHLLNESCSKIDMAS